MMTCSWLGHVCVTPSAVSQLLKGLESDLGTALFRRDNRAIAL